MSLLGCFSHPSLQLSYKCLHLDLVYDLIMEEKRFRKDVVHLSLNLVLNLHGRTAPGVNLCHHQCKGESSCSDGAVLIASLPFR